MALSLKVQYKGMSAPSAYITVSDPSISSDKQRVTFSAWYRASKDQDVFDWQTFSAPYSIDGANPFIQAYEYLKVQPHFAGCIDC